MRVLKFGGTSVGKPESLLNVKRIVEAISEPAIVVVSALGGLTDKLIQTARNASLKQAWREDWQAMVDRHHSIIEAVVSQENRQEVSRIVDELLEELARNYEGVELIGQLPEQTLDVIVSFGERMSAPIVAGMIEGAKLHYSPDFIKTEKWFEKNIADVSLTEKLILREFEGGVSREVMGGFIASDRDSGIITNLGRGGSDYTAALIAATLNADILDIWTDVDGFMTTDPRIVKSARVISEMSFVESMELCSFGAKVIYPPTIYPVFHKNIPIRILNTFNPSAPGTLITDSPRDAEEVVRGISAIRNMSLLTLSGPLTANVATTTSRSFNALARCGISLYLMSQADSEGNFSFAVAGADSENALKALNEEFAPELLAEELDTITLTDKLAIVAVVGDHISGATGLAPRCCHTLLRGGIPTVASSEGTSKTTVSIVIEETNTNEAIRLLHGLFFPETDEN